MIKDSLSKLKYRAKAKCKAVREAIWPPQLIPYTEIPIIINNFNRLAYLKKLITGLEQRGYTNIYILDNQSTYEPLLKFYKRCKQEVVFLDQNYGYRALWKSGVYKRFNKNYFAYTDSDLEIIAECPKDFLNHFRQILIREKLAYKVGFSLKIDDLPDHYPLKNEVIKWEKQFYLSPYAEGLYKAAIDTTFALYRPLSNRLVRSTNAEIYRTAHPYKARHLPWYVNPKNLEEEEAFYIKSSQEKSWVAKLAKKEGMQ